MTTDLWIELLARARLAGVHTLESLQELASIRFSKPPRRRIRVVEVRA
jgi:hypothetical protein